eukprot:8785383-Prorocentrum_lima.AAC.1
MQSAADRCVLATARVPGDRAGLSCRRRGSEAIACHDVWLLRCHVPVCCMGGRRDHCGVMARVGRGGPRP